ncbi:hypothetical protein SASPL_120990 [Salvia splendens]|uniref:Bifunctional inhibitor/plant lipid transfer protein/seed storage helical domain-containing protein n=1 Tax=Salvia splendens TaxID=180675 RepID=A0A8X8XQM7_SALSN|nr:hypothetical protein SASPL_120990 [Salvia splendens]
MIGRCPPQLPEEFRRAIEEMARGKELTAPATLVIQKELFRTDVSKNHNRLSIPASQISDGFLTEEERRRLRARRKGRVDVRVVDLRRCPRDALKLGVCANLLGGLLGVTIGTPPKQPCCSLIEGLADLEAAVCLCTAIKANVLGINLNVPVSLSLLLNVCSKKVPKGFVCA